MKRKPPTGWEFGIGEGYIEIGIPDKREFQWVWFKSLTLFKRLRFSAHLSNTRNWDNSGGINVDFHVTWTRRSHMFERYIRPIKERTANEQ